MQSIGRSRGGLKSPGRGKCYDQITRVNEAVADWGVKNGYDFDGESFCIYHVTGQCGTAGVWEACMTRYEKNGI